MNNYLD